MPFSARSAHGFTVHTIPSQCEFPRFASPVLKFLSRCLNSFTAFRTTTVLPSGGISCTSTTGYCRRVGTKHSNCASDRSSLWRFCLGTADGPASSRQAQHQQLRCFQKCCHLQDLLVCGQTSHYVFYLAGSLGTNMRPIVAVNDESYQ